MSSKAECGDVHEQEDVTAVQGVHRSCNAANFTDLALEEEKNKASCTAERRCGTHSLQADMALCSSPPSTASSCANHATFCSGVAIEPSSIKQQHCASSKRPAPRLLISPMTAESEQILELGVIDGAESDIDGAGMTCETPRAEEHRIPDPPKECPPPPRKKPRRKNFHDNHVQIAIDQSAVRSSLPLGEARINGRRTTGLCFFSPPPDLDTYPDFIRALFKS